MTARGTLAAGITLALMAGAPWARAEDVALEYQIKATYLYKFGAFVEWPAAEFASPTSPINVCVAGRDPFGDILDRATLGQHIGARPILVRRMAVAARNSGCQIMFIGGSDRQSVAQALGAMQGSSVLTVTDSDLDQGQAGGMVRFIVQDDHVLFDINPRAALDNGLVISSQLLSLAHSFGSNMGRTSP